MEATRWSRRPLPVNDRRTRPGIWRRARNRARTATHRSDERGGAISLWVVLMTPVSAFAAVVAMAGPQRLAAESSMQDAADDMAMFAVAWRDGHDMSTGELPAFPPECAARSEQQDADLALLEGDIETLKLLDPLDPGYAAQVTALDGRLNTELDRFGMQRPRFPATDGDELEARFDALVLRLDEWEEACTALSEALLRDLGYLGVDMGSLRGFYSDSIAEAPEVPCRTSAQTVVRDAVHVALAANWQDAGWAAAQVWPDGLPMAAESMGRMSQRDPVAAVLDCGEQLRLLDSQGRPMWAGASATPDSRELAQSVGRTPLSG